MHLLKSVVFHEDSPQSVSGVIKDATGEPVIGASALVKYATAGLDPNIFVQKYMIELPTEEEIKEFISSSNY